MSLVNNSFSEITTTLVKQTNIALEAMVQMNNSLTTENADVVIQVEGLDPITGDPSIYNYTIPAYPYILDQLQRISNSVDAFVSGEGVVLLNDGTYRDVKTIPLAIPPSQITGISAPTKFYSKNNWFFENLLFPQTFIRFDLKGKIDDRSDRVEMKRVIFDNFDDTETQWFIDNFVGAKYNYSDAITFLNNNNKQYWIDDETVFLPIKTNKYTGDFLILDTQIIDTNNWYYLNTINYGLVSDTSTVKNVELKVGDQIRYKEQSLFAISEIEITEKRIRITPLVGASNPTINSSFSIYSTPFEEKWTDFGVGYNECNILFIKGINDDYNLLGDEWSQSISFYTNDLTYENSVTGYESFYLSDVVDFGKQMEGQAKEKFVPAYFGVTPDAPTISSDQFGVNQVNTQLNAALDTEAIKNTQTQIESTKSLINSLKETLSQQKAELVELTDPAARSDLQSKINNNTNELSKQSIEYQSLVRSLSTVAYENDTVIGNAKYRVRGFFDIPSAKRLTDDINERPQEIVQFETAHRYLRLDGTGNPLNTYTYNDPSTGQPVTGTFTDWVIVPGASKKKVLDSSTGNYIWVNENIQDGQEVNINQVDIPIQKGEIVQMKLRSLSEAGWPSNPLKSSWSDTVDIPFPSNIQGSDQIVNILADSATEEEAIKFNQTLESAGLITHINDSVPNPGAGDGTYFKHQSKLLEVVVSSKNINGVLLQEYSSDLQAYLDDLANLYFVTLTRPSGGSGAAQKTITLQEVLQQIVEETPTIYDNL